MQLMMCSFELSVHLESMKAGWNGQSTGNRLRHLVLQVRLQFVFDGVLDVADGGPGSQCSQMSRGSGLDGSQDAQRCGLRYRPGLEGMLREQGLLQDQTGVRDRDRDGDRNWHRWGRRRRNGNWLYNAVMMAMMREVLMDNV